MVTAAQLDRVLLRPSACVTQHGITGTQWESLGTQALFQQTIFIFKTLCYTEGANKEGAHQKVGFFCQVCSCMLHMYYGSAAVELWNDYSTLATVWYVGFHFTLLRPTPVLSLI